MRRPRCALIGGLTVVIGLALSDIGCGKNASEPGADAAKTGKTVTSPEKTHAAPATQTTAGIQVKVPLGLPALPVPADNPITEAKVELGRMLYFDGRLSKDGKISCATCHEPQAAWAEHKPSSEGLAKQVGERNAPTVINAAYMAAMFWDGRAASLEEQALGPIENPIEMGHKMEVLLGQLENVPEYQQRFKAVFGTGVTKEGVSKAIAAFERTILSGNSPYDKFKAGDKNALNEQQKRGLQLFVGKGSCNDCHEAPVFSNGKYYNAGIGSKKDKPDPGRKKVTNNDADMGRFRVPHLRNAAESWPYFHDGSVEKLDDAVKTMATGGIDNPNLSSTFKGLRDVKLTDAEIGDLTAFVRALSGEFPVMQAPKLP